MKQYLDLLGNVKDNGKFKSDRTGVGTYSIFGHQMRFDLSQGFPICSTKKVPFRSVLSELLWFISGSTNANDLRQLLHGAEHRDDWNKTTIWDDNAAVQGSALGYEDGELGPIYGAQWRSWPIKGGFKDQLADVIEQIKTNPDSRRLIVSAWNVSELDEMALPPCHCLFQFYVHDGKLSCQLYQRSADVFLGVPFNIASYALLIRMIAQVTNLQVGEFIWTGGDVHLYKNHMKQAEEMLKRNPHELPKLVMNRRVKSIDDFVMTDFTLVNYYPYPPIPAPMAV